MCLIAPTSDKEVLPLISLYELKFGMEETCTVIVCDIILRQYIQIIRIQGKKCREK